jgi:hypothetical protein
MNSNRSKRWINLVVILLLCLGLAAASPGPRPAFAARGEAPNAPTVAVTPPASILEVGETVTVNLLATEMVDVYGAALSLTFNPAVVEVVDADLVKAGVQITPGVCPAPDFVVQNTVNNVTGTINYDVTSLAPSAPCNGSGVVASITFRALALGLSAVHFQSWLFSNTDGEALVVGAVDGSVEVIEETVTANLLISPGSATIFTGETVTLEILVENVADLYGVALGLSFDPAILEVVDADPAAAGVQISPGACPEPDFVVQNQVNNAAGTIQYDAVSLDPSPPCNGSGLVASITFHAIGPGVSPVHFGSWLLSDTDGVVIPATTADGSVTVNEAIGAMLWIDPPFDMVAVGGTTSVDIAIQDVADLYGIQVTLGFNPAYLEVVDADPVKVGVQITPGACPAPNFVVLNTVNNATGVIQYAASSLDPSPPCNGSGVVATITFRGKLVTASTPVEFTGWLLSDTDGFAIPAYAQDGALEVIPSAISGQVSLQGRTDHSGVRVSAWNGLVEVAFDLTDSAGNYQLPLSNGTYKVTAEMSRYLDGEKLNVVVSGGNVILNTVTLLGGDANNDDLVNVQDLAIIGSHFLMVCGNPSWDGRADINNDCVINILDLTLAGVNFQKTSPVPWP